MKERSALLAALILTMSAGLITGCGHRTSPQEAHQPTLAQQVQQIQNNPHMPQSAKDQAIAVIQRSSAQAQTNAGRK